MLKTNQTKQDATKVCKSDTLLQDLDSKCPRVSQAIDYPSTFIQSWRQNPGNQTNTVQFFLLLQAKPNSTSKVSFTQVAENTSPGPHP